MYILFPLNPCSGSCDCNFSRVDTLGCACYNKKSLTESTMELELRNCCLAVRVPLFYMQRLASWTPGAETATSSPLAVPCSCLVDRSLVSWSCVHLPDLWFQTDRHAQFSQCVFAPKSSRAPHLLLWSPGLLVTWSLIHCCSWTHGPLVPCRLALQRSFALALRARRNLPLSRRSVGRPWCSFLSPRSPLSSHLEHCLSSNISPCAGL